MSLHKAREFCGYLPKDVQEVIAEELGIPVSTVYGVVTFYSLFVMEPRGKYHISVCTGTACFVKGAMDVMDEFKLLLGIEPGETTPDGKFSIDSLRCIGACGLAPVVMVGEKIYGRVGTDDVMTILGEYKDQVTLFFKAPDFYSFRRLAPVSLFLFFLSPNKKAPATELKARMRP